MEIQKGKIDPGTRHMFNMCSQLKREKLTEVQRAIYDVVIEERSEDHNPESVDQHIKDHTFEDGDPSVFILHAYALRKVKEKTKDLGPSYEYIKEIGKNLKEKGNHDQPFYEAGMMGMEAARDTFIYKDFLEFDVVNEPQLDELLSQI